MAEGKQEKVVFVTGGNGFIGSHVVRALLESGRYRVRCLVRETSDLSRLEGLNVERVTGDVRDVASMRPGARGAWAIVHLASPSAWSDIKNPQMRAIVEEGTAHVLRLGEEEGCERIVYCSTVIAINGTDTPEVIDEEAQYELPPDEDLVYAHAKHAAEELCERAAARGVPVILVNPGEVYGPGDTSMVTAGNLVEFAQSFPTFASKGGTAVAHVDDVARGVVRALERGRVGARYILAGDNLTVEELARLTLDILGQKRKPVIIVPTGLLRKLNHAALRLGLPVPWEPMVVPYATRYWFVDNRRAVEELGVKFRPAREVLEPTLRWLQQEGHL